MKNIILAVSAILLLSACTKEPPKPEQKEHVVVTPPPAPYKPRVVPALPEEENIDTDALVDQVMSEGQ